MCASFLAYARLFLRTFHHVGKSQIFSLFHYPLHGLRLPAPEPHQQHSPWLDIPAIMENRNLKGTANYCNESQINSRLMILSKTPGSRDVHCSFGTSIFLVFCIIFGGRRVITVKDLSVFHVPRFKQKLRVFVINPYTIKADWLVLSFILSEFWLQIFWLHLFKTVKGAIYGLYVLCIAWLVLIFSFFLNASFFSLYLDFLKPRALF